MKLFKNTHVLLLVSLLGVYLLTHLIGLTQLPVFADEAIYIRWSQLLIDDWNRYFFFAMNDGKTPLFIWALAPLQFVIKDPLYAGRLVAVVFGLGQVAVMMQIVGLLSKNRVAQYLAGVVTMILPFWYFHHRMALMDGALTFFISLSVYGIIKMVKLKLLAFDANRVRLIIFTGVFFWLALLTKLPAILFSPAFFVLLFIKGKVTKNSLYINGLSILLSIALGIALFSLLIFTGNIGQLFSRGSDFLFSFNEVFVQGKWQDTLSSVPTYIYYFVTYLTPSFIIFILIGLFLKRNQVVTHAFFWAGILYVLPIAVMGQVVYPRYLFPATLFFTLSGVFSIEAYFSTYLHSSRKLLTQMILTTFGVLLVANSVTSALFFIFTSTTRANETPFVSSDVTQYLTEWSSGHGLVEVSELIKQTAQTTTVAVGTEGYFGTLPDGLVLYFHRQNVDNIYIDGIGYPVGAIPKQFALRAANFEKKWIVVNSHRMNIELPDELLIAEYCRPYAAPCLQVWDVTSQFDSLVQ